MQEGEEAHNIRQTCSPNTSQALERFKPYYSFRLHDNGGSGRQRPELRQGDGGTAGETLNFIATAFRRGNDADAEVYLKDAELMVCGSHQFPAVWYEGEWVPEARSYKQVKLPHEHTDADELFPKATVRDTDLGLEDSSRPCDLEKAGLAIAQTKVPGRPNAAQTTHGSTSQSTTGATAPTTTTTTTPTMNTTTTGHKRFKHDVKVTGAVIPKMHSKLKHAVTLAQYVVV